MPASRDRRTGRGGHQERSAPDLPAALAIAERFLAPRPRSRREVDQRLQRAGAEDEVRAAAISRLERAGYLDDEAFARYWVEQRDCHSPRGLALLRAELRRLGVATEIIAEALSGAARMPEGGGPVPGAPPEGERARDALQRHLRGRTLDRADPRATARSLAYLQRRGFDLDTARRAVRSAVTAGRAGDPLDEVPDPD